MGAWLVVGAVFLLGLAAVSIFAAFRLTRLRSKVELAWDQLALALRRRHALAGELAQAVAARGADADVLGRFAEARTVADLPGASSPQEQAVSEHGLDVALDELTGLVDASAGLRRDTELTALRTSLDDAQHRVDARRRDYDVAARMLAEAAGRWPGRWVAGSMGVGPVPPAQ
ncbi:MAG: LemA family protein [Jiangellaceae bacterium]